MNPGVIINFSTALLTLVIGCMVLFGSFQFNNPTTKYLFGIVLLAYGVYRFITTFSKIRQTKLQEKINKIEEEREKFISRK